MANILVRQQRLGVGIDPTSQWPSIDIDALEEESREVFLRRKKGILLYLAGATDKEIREGCGFGRSQIYRLITERCQKQHEDGTLYGWRGAIPNLRTKAWKRKSPPKPPSICGAGTAGSLQWIFESPNGHDLEQAFRSRILGNKRSSLEAPQRRDIALFSWFLNELRTRGFENRGEWPFNVEKLGYNTIIKFIDRVLSENPVRQRKLLGGEDADRKARAGDGVDRPALRPFQRVECDAHKIDARMVVMVPTPHGGYEPRTIHRIWVIVIIEVVSRSVLGYHLSLHRECSAEDVLRAIKRALTRWSPRELQFSDNAYVSEAGLPSARHDRYLGACWDEFSVDGAMANICKRVERQLDESVGAIILKPQDPNSFSSRRSKDDRPFIESFFLHLAKGGFHKLSVTTGSSPKEKHGADPDGAAHATQFQLEYAEELLDTLIANYNATPHSGLGYRSPLTQLDFLTSREPEQIRQADPEQVGRMVGIRKLCTVKGGVSQGRRPYFNFANARYSAEWLCLRTDLIGKNLWLHIENEDDARWATVSTQSGEFLGAVRAAPPWHLTPHTLYIRQSIRSLDKRRLIQLSSQCDAIEELVRYAESSENKKLQPHPAYLETRRVLQMHAERLAGQSMVAHHRDTATATQAETKVKSRSSGTASGGRAHPAVAAATPTDRAENTDKPTTALPPMRMARIW
ncbi:MAG: hypothetical protein K2X79_06900 [Burkholderiaceae bacterium]|nr:hypothetical protein [Burkholderiaceae bacterium]